MATPDVTLKLQARVSGFQKDILAARKTFGGFADGILGSAKVIKNAGQGLQKFGKMMTLGITLPVAGAGIASVKMSIDFNAAMAKIATLIPGNVERVKELKTGIQDLAIESGKSTADLADGMFEVISAFGDGAESMDRLRVVARGSVAGLSSTTEALDLLSAVTKAYGDTSVDSLVKVSDLAFLTNKLGQTTFPELAASLGNVTAESTLVGISQEELFASFATLTGITGKANKVSTQLAATFRASLTPSEKMKDLLKLLGFASGEAMIEQLGLKDSLIRVAEEAKRAGVPLQKFITSEEGIKAAAILTGSQLEKFGTNLEAMEDSAGATDEAFKEMTEGINKLGFKLDQLKQIFVVASQRLGDTFEPILIKIVDGIKALFTRFEELDPQIKIAMASFIAAAAAGGPLILALGFIIANLPLMVAGLAVVSVALTEPFKKALKSGVGSVNEIIRIFKDWNKGMISNQEAIKKAKEVVLEFFGKMKDGAIESLGVIFQWLKDWEGENKLVETALKKFTDIVVDLFGRVLRGGVETAIKAIPGLIWDSIVRGLNIILAPLALAIRGVINLFKGMSDELVGNSIIPDMMGMIVDDFKDMGSDVNVQVRAVADNTITNFRSMARTLGKKDLIPAMTGKITGAFTDLKTDLGTIVTSILDGLWDQLVIRFNNIVQFVLGAIRRLIQTFKDLAAATSNQTLTPSVSSVTAAGSAGVGSLPVFDHGGIVTRPTLAILAKNNQPEAVIPLSKFGGLGGGGNVFNIIVSVKEASNLSRSEWAKILKRNLGGAMEDINRQGFRSPLQPKPI